MKPSTRISSLLALAAVAVSPAGASAQAVPSAIAPFVIEKIGDTNGLARLSSGNGAIAWTDDDITPDSTTKGTTVWTLRDGRPAIAAKLPQIDGWHIETGTDAAGNPLAIVGDFPHRRTRTPFFLVRLDTGAVAQLHLQAHALQVTDVAIDAGRILYVTTPLHSTAHGRSTLWSARLRGAALTKRARVRRSRRGEFFETVRADRGRIAVSGRHKVDSDQIDLPLYEGRVQGPWRKLATGSSSGGGVFTEAVAGYTRDGRSAIVTDSGPIHFTVQRISLRTGRARDLKLELTAAQGDAEIQGAYDPSSDRLLLSSLADAGGYQLGWSSVLG